MNLVIVLVHLGTSKCDHLWANAERIESIWPDLKLWLILDDEINISIARTSKYNVFDYREYRIDQNNFSSDEFRNGFWKLTRQRLSALFKFHQKYPEIKILHIENDILLLRNFPFDYFEKIELNAWMKVSLNNDSAAIIYLPGIESTNWLEAQFESLINIDNHITDMQILSKIRLLHPEQVVLLPTLDNNAEKVSGLFDSGALGMWITGEEPRNNFGITRRFNNRFNLEIFQKYKQPFSLNETILQLKSDANTVFYNLHVHSKDLKLIRKDAEKKLNVLLMPHSKIFRRYAFSPKILIEIVIEYRNRKKLIALIAALPGLRRVRNLFKS